jgi:hypothetical protein
MAPGLGTVPAWRLGTVPCVGSADPTYSYVLADVNGDGVVNGYDIDPFVGVLVGN